MAKDRSVSRRDLLKAAGTVTAAATAIPTAQGFPAIRTVKAASEQVQFGIIGTGSRGQYLLKHLRGIDNGRCVAICDIQQPNADKAVKFIGNSPKTYKDYRELLADKSVEAVFVTTPLFEHYRVMKDALMAGKHVFCEKCLVFKPEEVHALRALAAQYPKQILQTGLQRRYSYFYQTVRQMIEKGILGDVHHIHAQWHRNMVNKPSSLWVMKPGGESNINNWRLYRSMSGGLPAELTSHQVDVADWMFGQTPDFVMGLGSLDTLKDGRNVYDNVQLVYKYPKGQKLTYSSISTNSFSPYFNAQRTEMAECIMGTEGTIAITVGGDTPAVNIPGMDKVEYAFQPPIAWWYREPPKAVTVTKANSKTKEAAPAGATMISGSGANGPIPLMTSDIEFGKNESFWGREVKFARRWLTAKGVMVQEEQRNPVDVELESFFNCCRSGKTPIANLEIGMQDAIAVILSNQAMDEERKVYFNEIEKMGKEAPKGKEALKKG
jgi:predicted dehydrogenase